MRRVRRWFLAFAAPLILAGCASSSDVGDDEFTAEDALWTGLYVGVIVLGVAGAKALVDANE